MIKWSGIAAALFAVSAGPAQAGVISLFEYAFNIDGTVADGADPLPASIDTSGFDDVTGLGNITVTVTGAGSHSVLGFFDHEIDQGTNTFFNELGAVFGAAPAGQSWEIDEPEYVFGDIFTNFTNGTLDNTIAGIFESLGDDVSMAMGFDFTLLAAQTAIVTFFLDTIQPLTGFYLGQFDPDSSAPNQVFLRSALSITGGGEPPPTSVPEPTTLALLGIGLLTLAARRRAAR